MTIHNNNPDARPASTYTPTNHGRCNITACKSSTGPRCTSGFCETCCNDMHCYWVGHTRADGTVVEPKPYQASEHTPNRQHSNFCVCIACKREKAAPMEYDDSKPPEFGTAKEVGDEQRVFIGLSTWASRGVAGEWPIDYV